MVGRPPRQRLRSSPLGGSSQPAKPAGYILVKRRSCQEGSSQRAWQTTRSDGLPHLPTRITPVERRSRRLGNWADRACHWKRSLIPGRRVPWLAMESDRLFHILSEVLVYNRVRAAGFHGGDHFGDSAAPPDRRRLEHGYRTANALPDLRTPFHRCRLVFRAKTAPLRDCEEIAGIAGLTGAKKRPPFRRLDPLKTSPQARLPAPQGPLQQTTQGDRLSHSDTHPHHA